jgi:hypothetical protein
VVKTFPLAAAAWALSVVLSGASSERAVQPSHYPDPSETGGMAYEPVDADALAIMTEALDFVVGFERRRGKLSFVSMTEIDPACDAARDPLCVRIDDPPDALMLSLNLRGCFLPASGEVPREKQYNDYVNSPGTNGSSNAGAGHLPKTGSIAPLKLA